MKSLLMLISILSCTALIAQNDVTWIGGTPGKQADWNEARNWSNQRVPDEYSNVIIKWANSGHHAQPVISGEANVLSIEIHGGATLSLEEDAHLSIDGGHAYTLGIQLYGGRLVNDGQIDLHNIDHLSAEVVRQQCEGKGVVYIDDLMSHEQQVAETSY